MLEVFSTETLEAILDALPVEVSFIDDADTVRYYSKGNQRIGYQRLKVRQERCSRILD